MSESKFKTMRHIETVRNFIDYVVSDLKHRAQMHDQTKLQSPEVEVFEEYTPKLRDVTYGSEGYKGYMENMRVAIDHHNKENRHHPEHHVNGINDMNLLDLLEMLLDWKAATLRHNDGDISKSLEINQKRFGYSDELKRILLKTLIYLDLVYQSDACVYNHADES